MKTYRHDGKTLSIVYYDEDWVGGLNFITPDELFIQVGSWWYNEGKKLDSHIHNEFSRKATRTQEMVYVKRGSMRVILYTEGKEYYDEYILKTGDLAVFVYGGHGYEILEDGTQIIEAKNGPFIDVETDKTKFLICPP